MSRTLLVGIGTEVELDSASTLDNATVIRVWNSHASDTYTVSIAKTSSGGFISTATVSMPAGRIEFFEKGPNDQISASNSAVKGFKVGFTG
jgi:hypothetical protein